MHSLLGNVPVLDHPMRKCMIVWHWCEISTSRSVEIESSCWKGDHWNQKPGTYYHWVSISRSNTLTRRRGRLLAITSGIFPIIVCRQVMVLLQITAFPYLCLGRTYLMPVVHRDIEMAAALLSRAGNPWRCSSNIPNEGYINTSNPATKLTELEVGNTSWLHVSLELSFIIPSPPVGTDSLLPAFDRYRQGLILILHTSSN